MTDPEMRTGYSIVRVCDWLPPDYGAVGQCTIQFAQRDAEAGHQVLVIGFSSAKSSRSVSQVASGSVTYLRLRMPSLDRSSYWARLIWTLRANLKLVGAIWKNAKMAGEIHFTGSPPFLLHFIVPMNILWRKKITYLITDFYPECIMAARSRPSFLLNVFHALTCRLRHYVDQFEALGFDQARHLLNIGIPDDRIRIRRDLSPVEVNGATPPLERPPESKGRALLLYSGNYGIAHEVDTFLNGYLTHHQRGTGRTILWLNAVGEGALVVESRLAAAGVPFIRSRPLPLSEVPSLLRTPDAHLITLKDNFVGYVMPSKTYGCIDSQRDILFVGSDRSDVDLLCRERLGQDVAYWRAGVGDADAVAAALESIADRALLPVSRRLLAE